MKTRAVVTSLLISAGALSLAACGQVQPGHVGIKINQYGSGAGVSAEPLQVGTYFTPFGTNIIEYPVFTQTYTYTASQNEGAANNEEFTFNDKNGLNISADIGVSYSVNPELAPKLYSKFRTDATGLVAPTRSATPSATRSTTTPARSGGRRDLRSKEGGSAVHAGARGRTLISRYFAPYGLNIEKLFWAGTLRLPQSVHGQINLRIANEQAALAAQANVATATANAQAKVEAAKGDAQANQLIAGSLKSQPARSSSCRALSKKWNGQLPTYASNGPLPFIGNPSK